MWAKGSNESAPSLQPPNCLAVYTQNRGWRDTSLHTPGLNLLHYRPFRKQLTGYGTIHTDVPNYYYP